MKKPRVIRVYNLVDCKGNKLLLEFGIISVDRESLSLDPIMHGDNGYRWRFIGKHIPMPVRSMYWFNGFPEPIMLDWLKGNGWFAHTRVEMCNGYTEVYELPKGNEEPDGIGNMVQSAVIHAIRLLWQNKLYIRAIYLYRHIYGGTLDDARVAVREIVDEQE